MSLQQYGDALAKVLENTSVEDKDNFITNVLLIINNVNYSEKEKVDRISESLNEYFLNRIK